MVSSSLCHVICFKPCSLLLVLSLRLVRHSEIVCVCVCVCKREREWEKDRQRRQTRGRPRDKGDVCLHLRSGVYMSGWVCKEACVFMWTRTIFLSLSALSIYEPLFREGAGESDVSWWWFFRVWRAACIDVRWDEWFRPSGSLSAPPKAAATSLSKNCSATSYSSLSPLLLSYLHTHLIMRKTSRVQPGSYFTPKWVTKSTWKAQ